jgi:Na+/H+ antiporter NhaD/arsenite permease-like protein
LAIIHTFAVSSIRKLGHRFAHGSLGENICELLGEVEVVFGLWSAILLICYSILHGVGSAVHYLETRNFTEPIFVFVILTICSTKAILELAEDGITFLSKILPFHPSLSFYMTALVVGPALGSFITEPAAMTVTALLLLKHFYSHHHLSHYLKYATIGLLFVNVSICGTLTPYAAPPVLMVAKKWSLDLAHMFFHYGVKALISAIISTSVICFLFKEELKKISLQNQEHKKSSPLWIKITHLLFLISIILTMHHAVVVVGIFLFFLGFLQVTKDFQNALRLREGLLVSFFLGGLVVLGGLQDWWLSPILQNLSAFPLYLGAIGLTAITDNAALTYLGSLVPNLSSTSQYALLSGAVVGGGLTVIANAPNPAGYSILHKSFGERGIQPLPLFLAALFPTVVAAVCFWMFV